MVRVILRKNKFKILVYFDFKIYKEVVIKIILD